MEKIWLRSYPPGMPAEVDVDRYPSLKALLSYSVFIAVLLLRPEGLFTRKSRKA